jgi:hypothetical protein
LDESEETAIWMAEDDDGLVGTISVTKDGRCGLSVDAAFPAMTWAVRDATVFAGWQLGAAWRMIVKPAVLRSRVCVRRRLIDAALDDMVQRGLDATLYEIHPRHVRFYERRLGLVEIGRIKHNETVGGAPAVLMLGRLPVMLEEWKR